MAEKVAKVGVKRDTNFMYFIKGGDVWRVPRKQPGKPKGKSEKVAEVGVQVDNAFIYFLDKNGDVARAKRAVGGQKRKKKAPAKKAARKPAAKKTVAKKTAAKKAAPKAKAKAKAPAKKAAKKGKR